MTSHNNSYNSKICPQINDFKSFLHVLFRFEGAGYPPVWVICWLFFS